MDSYQELVEIVRKVDPAAADYLDTDARKRHDFYPCGCLNLVMRWQDTPQGFAYWDEVSEKIGR
jgi:hypothetical protein